MDKKKLRYAILKEIYNGNKMFTEKELKVTEEEFDEAVHYLHKEKYISGFIYADDRPWEFSANAYLTEKGENYLAENSSMAKTYKGLKEIREWLF